MQAHRLVIFIIYFFGSWKLIRKHHWNCVVCSLRWLNFTSWKAFYIFLRLLDCWPKTAAIFILNGVFCCGSHFGIVAIWATAVHCLKGLLFIKEHIISLSQGSGQYVIIVFILMTFIRCQPSKGIKLITILEYIFFSSSSE